MVLRFAENYGSSNADAFLGAPSNLVFGFAGNDQFAPLGGGDFQIFAGGIGADTYIATNEAAMTVLDLGGSGGDLVIATGIGFTRNSSFAATIDDRHLVAGDTVSGQVVFVLDWLTGASQVELVQTADGVLSVGTVAGLLPTAPNFLGNVTWESLGAFGLTPLSTAEVNEAIAFYGARHAALSNKAALFDEAFYLTANSDVKAAVDVGAISSGFAHFILSGEGEGRAPNALFDPAFYLAANPDIAAAGADPLTHYLDFGGFEGRDPSAGFDSSFYLDSNQDIAAAGINPLAHYLAFGAAEGRAPTAESVEAGLIGVNMLDIGADGFVF